MGTPHQSKYSLRTDAIRKASTVLAHQGQILRALPRMRTSFEHFLTCPKTGATHPSTIALTPFRLVVSSPPAIHPSFYSFTLSHVSASPILYNTSLSMPKLL